MTVSVAPLGLGNLTLDGSDILALRNGTTLQSSRIYGTYANGGTDFERLEFRATASGFEINSTQGGTGVARPLRLGVNGTYQWAINTGGMFLAAVDNTYDIGASGSARPRNLYMASWVRHATSTVATLPAAATAGAGAVMFVTDALSPTFGVAVAGGGAVTVPVYSTGSAWNVG